ncbi:MAG: hypothetical protein L0312_16520 [Acidobacteria bacterium]|nr:hypothetical protein [Acidobacteriota bacterium]
MAYVNAREIIGTRFPPEEGEKLADALMREHDDWSCLIVDLRRCPPSLLISAFFNAFLQKVYEERPDLLRAAREIEWQLAYPFQTDNVKTWVADFKPYTPT